MIRDAVQHARIELRKVARAETQVHGRLRRHVLTIVVFTIGVDLICAAAAFVFEHHQRGTEVKSFGSALFWTTTQLLTVSSQLRNPLSTPARLLDVFMEAWAITVVASLAAAIGAFLVKRG